MGLELLSHTSTLNQPNFILIIDLSAHTSEMLLAACLKCSDHWTPCSSWGPALNNISLGLSRCDGHTPWLIILTINVHIQTSFLVCKAGLLPVGISFRSLDQGMFQVKQGFLEKYHISVKSFSESTPSTGMICLTLFVLEKPVLVTLLPIIF